MTSANLFTPSATTQSQTTLGANTDSAPQTEGQALYQQASQSPQPEAVVKRQFEQRNRDQKTQLANEFIASAGRQGINDLTATPDGQHALAVVYEHAGDEARDLVRQVHEEQGNTAVDYSGPQDVDRDDPLGVSDAGVKIGPRLSGFQYTAMTAGVAYGLAENTVMGLVDMGKTVCEESEALKNIDNIEFLDIDSTGQKSDSPGLSLPSWEDIGKCLKRNIQATNQAIATAKQQGSYFTAGKAISNDPLLQMTGLGDMAVFGSLARMHKLAKLESLATDTPRKLGGGAVAAGDDKLSSIDGNKVSEADGGVGANALSDASVQSEIVGPIKSTTAQRIAKLDLEGHASIRHGGPNRVTDLQLEDRAMRGIDPASGTTFDAFNKFPDGSPKPHKVGRNATAFISDDALLQADDFARSSPQFQQNVAAARANGDIFVDPVEIPLGDVFGNNYQNYVRGVTRLGSKSNPTGHILTDFTDGTIKAIYRLDQNGNVKLHTLYPNPKP